VTVRTKITPINQWIELVVSRNLSPKARQEAVAKFARSRLAETQAANAAALGQAPDYTQTVDGKRGAALETVNPDRGRITFEFDIVTDVLTWIMQELRHRSPVLSGAYREGHRLFADGVEVDIANVPPAEEYSFTNTVPYSRKIEVGTTKSGRQFTINVDEYRPYDHVSAEAARRFGNIARIGYTFRGIVGGYQIAASSSPVARKRTAKGRFAAGTISAHNRKDMRYPTITVRPL
jgi:hypothetical protein